MRVLDIGSGVGDVAFLAAGLVGRSGEVVGVDRSSAALERAEIRRRDLSFDNVSFRIGDPTSMAFDSPFDAVIGRYVLQFQTDPSDLLRQLRTHAARGSVIAFHELDWGGVQSFPALATRDQCCRWISETLRRNETETRMGAKLYSAFVSADLEPPSLIVRSVAAGPVHAKQFVDLEVDVAKTLLPEMVRLGIASEDEVGIGTLAERIYGEMKSTGSVLFGRNEICAWTTA